MRSASKRLVSAVALATAAAAGVALAATPAQATPGKAGAPKGPTMDIQLLSFNDFHGNLEPPSGSSGRVIVSDTYHEVAPTPPSTRWSIAADTVNAGGVEYLASHLAAARVGHPYSLTVAAGDIVGASPLLSAAFHDEPSIEAMNALKLDVTSVGNHEFDEGYKEIQRLASGGCIDDGAGALNQDSCPGGKSFTGANFPILAANVRYKATGETILPATWVKNFTGAKIGFIGMTLKDTPSIVTASGIQGLEFTDEVETANALVPQLEAQGVKAIVVLIHQGALPKKTASWPGGPNTAPASNLENRFDSACQAGGSLDEPASPIIDIAKNLDPQIDMIVSGHTHTPYVCSINDKAGNPRLVTSASSFGRLFTETTMTYDRRTQDIVRASVTGSNMVVTRDVPKDPTETSIIGRYKTLIAPIASRVIGSVTGDVTNSANPAGESQLGDLIADAQLADPSTVTGGQVPVIGFMNPGGIRTSLTYSASSWGEKPGDITFEEAFTVQPFNNYLVSMTLTGQQIIDMLNQQRTGKNAARPNMLQVSQGFSYSYSGTTVLDNTVKLGDAVLDKAAPYRIVTNNFLADGGDNFPGFTKGTGRYFGGLDIDAFAKYLPAVSPYTPAPLTRITSS